MPVPDATPDATDNLDLAMTARRMADSAPDGSLRQAAAGSVAVTCATTRDLAEARHVLKGVVPHRVQHAALELLEELAGRGGAKILLDPLRRRHTTPHR